MPISLSTPDFFTSTKQQACNRQLNRPYSQPSARLLYIFFLKQGTPSSQWPAVLTVSRHHMKVSKGREGIFV
ncbi:hypothetical protein Gasu2_03680 [Galdieria sulphuraria]|nr:hypothetical protein Gasu2_03680 [Galdieria sulphuraria]